MPECSKYHAKWQFLVPNCYKYKANGTRKENKKQQNLNQKNPKTNLNPYTILYYTGLYYTIYIVLFYSMLCYTIYYTLLYYTIWCYTMSYCSCWPQLWRPTESNDGFGSVSLDVAGWRLDAGDDSWDGFAAVAEVISWYWPAKVVIGNPSQALDTGESNFLLNDFDLVMVSWC